MTRTDSEFGWRGGPDSGIGDLTGGIGPENGGYFPKLISGIYFLKILYTCVKLVFCGADTNMGALGRGYNPAGYHDLRARYTPIGGTDTRAPIFGPGLSGAVG